MVGWTTVTANWTKKTNKQTITFDWRDNSSQMDWTDNNRQTDRK